MLAVDRAVYAESSFTLPSSALQQFIHDPLLYISKWYHSTSPSRGAAERALPKQSAAAVRLHENAESCLSSLEAGTASILQQTEKGVHLLTLPVSPCLQRAPPTCIYLSPSDRCHGSLFGINCTQVAVHLHIFSFLDAQSLCRLSQTCDYLHSLAGDPLLWTRMLRRDVHTWRVIGHLSHPKVYEDTSSDLSPKQM